MLEELRNLMCLRGPGRLERFEGLWCLRKLKRLGRLESLRHSRGLRRWLREFDTRGRGGWQGFGESGGRRLFRQKFR